MPLGTPRAWSRPVINAHKRKHAGMRVALQHLLGDVARHAPDGFMPLGLAVFFGHPETVDVLLKAGANVNATTRETMKVTPLASAAAARQFGIARVLIANGANVNAQAENDFTPLHEVAARGDLEFATLLLDHGANINSKTKDGKTPLSFAQEHKQAAMVEFLRNRGGNF